MYHRRMAGQDIGRHGTHWLGVRFELTGAAATFARSAGVGQEVAFTSWRGATFERSLRNGYANPSRVCPMRR